MKLGQPGLQLNLYCYHSPRRVMVGRIQRWLLRCSGPHPRIISGLFVSLLLEVEPLCQMMHTLFFSDMAASFQTTICTMYLVLCIVLYIGFPDASLLLIFVSLIPSQVPSWKDKSFMRLYQYHLNKNALISWQNSLIEEMTEPIASSCPKNHRKRYYMTRFIATMIMTLTLMSDVDRNRKSVIATPGDF